MHPVLFRLPSANGILTIKSYSFFLVLAIIAAVSISLFFLQKQKITKRKAATLLLTMVLAVPVGARLLHILSNRSYYNGDLHKMLNLHPAGFALYGGLILAVLAAWLVLRIMKVNVWQAADALTPGLGIGIAISRIGCYLNGCCFGKPTNVAWGVIFPPGSPASTYQLQGKDFGNSLFHFFSYTAVHPTQLYELLAALLGTILALIIMRHQRSSGTAFLTFVIWFTAFRWINWHFRVPSATLAVPPWFYPALYASIIIIAAFSLQKKLSRGRGC